MVCHKETVLSIFSGDNPQEVVWQPRIENWYDVNKNEGTLPPEYKGLSLLEVYDKLECSPRPYLHAHSDWTTSENKKGGYCPQNPPPVWKVTVEGNIQPEYKEEDGELIETWKTPKGRLSRVWGVSKLSIVPHVIDHPVKQIEDLEIMEYILDHQKVQFNSDDYRQVEKKIGNRAPIAFNAPKAPFQRLILFYMNYQKAIIALYKHPKRMKEFLQVAEEADDRFYEVIKHSPVDIVNFPDNIDAQFDSPPLLESYLLPHWKKRTAELRQAGKYTDVHWDGSIKPILKYASEVGVDGFEALTPKPQGDVTIKEIRQALGEKQVLLDGIPATMFMPQANEEALLEIVDELIELFAPNLILGISDELPANGDIEKVGLVSDYVKQYNSP